MDKPTTRNTDRRLASHDRGLVSFSNRAWDSGATRGSQGMAPVSERVQNTVQAAQERERSRLQVGRPSSTAQAHRRAESERARTHRGGKTFVEGAITVPSCPAAWTPETFTKADAVDVPNGYRRCRYMKNGWRCRTIYTGGRSTHAHCGKHQGMKGEYEPPPTFTDIVARTIDELGRASLKQLTAKLGESPHKVRSAANRAANNGLVLRGRRPGFFISKT